jgi:hypothetical protein
MIEFLVGLITGMALGMWLLSRWIIFKIQHLLVNDPELQEIQTQQSVSVIDARLERLGDQYFVYDTADGRFLAQGHNLDDVRSKMDASMKGQHVMVRVVEGDPDDIRRFQEAA